MVTTAVNTVLLRRCCHVAVRYELHVLLVEHGKVCKQCFKRSKAGEKRKGKAAGAAAEACPLMMFKRANFSSSSLAAAQASSSSGKSPPGATAPVSDVQQVAAGVVVKTEQGDGGLVEAAVAVKVEQPEQLHIEAAAVTQVKQEPQQLEAPCSQPAAAGQRTRKRTKRA